MSMTSAQWHVVKLASVSSATFTVVAMFFGDTLVGPARWLVAHGHEIWPLALVALAAGGPVLGVIGVRLAAMRARRAARRRLGRPLPVPDSPDVGLRCEAITVQGRVAALRDGEVILSTDRGRIRLDPDHRVLTGSVERWRPAGVDRELVTGAVVWARGALRRLPAQHGACGYRDLAADFELTGDPALVAAARSRVRGPGAWALLGRLLSGLAVFAVVFVATPELALHAPARFVPGVCDREPAQCQKCLDDVRRSGQPESLCYGEREPPVSLLAVAALGPFTRERVLGQPD